MVKLDLGKFKKISSDGDSTLMRHADGHEMRIAHKSLSPKMRQALTDLPSHEEKPKKTMRDGGTIATPKEIEKGSQSSGFTPSAWMENAKQFLEPTPTSSPAPQNKAKGGKVEKKNYDEGGYVAPKDPTSDMPTSSDVSDVEDKAPPTTTSLTPEQIGAQLKYNQMITALLTNQADSPVMAQGIDASGYLFDTERGTPPDRDKARPELWSKSVAQQKLEDDLAYAKNNDAYNAAVKRNQDLVGMGYQPQPLPPQPIPPNPQQIQKDQNLPGAGNQPTPTADISAARLPADPYGTQGALEAYGQGLGEKEKGIEQEAAAKQLEAGMQQKAYENAITNQQEAKDRYLKEYGSLDKERQALQYDLANQHIDPNHYLNSMGTVGRISNAIGLLLGGMGGGILGQENPALKFMNAQIDRDIEAQKMDLGRKESLLSANMRQFGNLHDATLMTTAMQRDIVANQIKMAAAKAASPMAQANMYKQAGDLHMQASAQIGQLAMRRAVLKSMSENNNDPAKFGAMTSLMRASGMGDMAKDLEAKFVPGVGMAAVPVPEKDRQEMITRKDLQDQIVNLNKFAMSHSGDINVDDMKFGAGLAKQAQDAYRRANGQGVFREAEKDFVNGVISDNPTAFFNKYRTQPGYRSVIEVNNNTLQNLKKGYGLPSDEPINKTSGFKHKK